MIAMHEAARHCTRNLLMHQKVVVASLYKQTTAMMAKEHNIHKNPSSLFLANKKE